MTDLIEHVGRLAADFLTSEAGKKVITEAVGKCVKSAVESATGYGSAFSKSLQKAVTDKLAVPADFDLPVYHDHITKVVLAVVKDGMDKAISTQVESRLKEIIRPVPATIKLSDIAEEYRKGREEEYKAGGGGDENFTLSVSQRDGFVYLAMDKSEHTPEHRCEIKLGVYKGKIFSLTFGSRQIEKELFVGNVYNFERFLFQLRAANTEIIEDLEAIEDVSTYVGHD
jgi:hypothetical protein